MAAVELEPRLQRFLAQWRDMKPAPAQPFASRLGAFLRQWRSLGGAVALRPDKQPILLARLERTFEDLRLALLRHQTKLEPVNIWQVTGFARQERRAADALAWLLNPRSTHGLGILPITAFFEALGSTGSTPSTPTDLTRSKISVEERPMGSARDRIDLVIDHPGLLTYVEIKIDAAEGPQQLSRYVEAAEETSRLLGRASWCVVYLTCSARSVVHKGIIPLRWGDLARSIRTHLLQGTRDPNSITPVLQLLRMLEDL